MHAHITSDASRIDVTAAALSVPRADPADSFILHAPLELLARAALLPMVESHARDDAHERLRWLADTFTAWGEAAEALPATVFDDADQAGATLQRALTDGDVDGADAAASWLAGHLEADELARALADQLLPLLSAAGHGSIFLHQLPRIAPRSRLVAATARGLVRELARYPGWELSWHRDAPPAAPGAAAALAERLLAPASPGDPGSDFIFPIMSLTEGSGLAGEVLGDVVRGLSVADARRVLLRTAALSMLQDDAEASPYGWTHCLSMPQATLGIASACAEPWQAVAVAATYVLGFRAVHGRVPLDLAWTPPPPASNDPIEQLEAAPAEAAAAVWHAEPAARPALRARLASRAAAHHDAHLAKYTLACFDAAHSDPGAEPLYLAAAAHLSAWWAIHDQQDELLAG